MAETAEETERAQRKTLRVMVAMDDSDCSRYALSWALRNLLSSDTHLIIFAAQPLLEFSYVFATSTYATTPVDLVNDLQEIQRKATLALLKEAKDLCSQHGVIDVETIAEVGEPKDAICEAVKKHGIQLLLLGSHGRGAIQRAFLGSVSNYCVHNAECPVLVVRQPK